MPRYTPAQRSEALAVYQLTGNMSAAAREVGATINAVKRWIQMAELQETEADKTLAEDSERRAEAIRDTQERVRQALLDRMVLLAGQVENVRDAATAYGILTDKALLAQGRPTQIHGEQIAIPADAGPDELAELADRLRERRESVPARPAR